MNAAVDVERQSAEDVAAAWVEESGITDGLEQGSGAITVGGADFTESHVLANVYANVLTAAGFDASVREVGSRELYLPPSRRAARSRSSPSTWPPSTEFLEGDEANQVASGDVDATLEALQPLAEEAGLVVRRAGRGRRPERLRRDPGVRRPGRRHHPVRAGRGLRRRIAGPRRSARVPGAGRSASRVSRRPTAWSSPSFQEYSTPAAR